MTTVQEFFSGQQERVVRRFGTGAGLGPFRSQVRAYGAKQPAGWSDRMTRMQAGAITMSSAALNQFVFDTAARLAPAIAMAIEDHVVPMFERARSQWPVRSGRSADGLVLGLSIEGTNIVSSISSAAPYTWFIRYASKAFVDFELRKQRLATLREIIGPEGPKPGDFKRAAEAHGRSTRTEDMYWAWRRRNDPPPPRYAGPSGEGVIGAHAWSTQVYGPGTRVVHAMADTVTAGLDRGAS